MTRKMDKIEDILSVNELNALYDVSKKILTGTSENEIVTIETQFGKLTFKRWKIN